MKLKILAIVIAIITLILSAILFVASFVSLLSELADMNKVNDPLVTVSPRFPITATADTTTNWSEFQNGEESTIHLILKEPANEEVN